MQETEFTAVQQTAETDVYAVASKFAERGLKISALREIEAQEAREKRTREQDPLAYRLSEMDEATVTAYRGGKDSMSGEDLLRYAGENRALNVADRDFAANTVGIYESAQAYALEPAVKRPTAMDTVRNVKERLEHLPAQTARTVKQRLPLWFDPRKGSTENEKRRFPLSAFAAVAAVAVSMLLIVSGSLMVIGAETQISRINSQITDLRGEVADLRSDLESTVDLLEIRRIATEEYGMVEEEFLKMDYVVLDREEIAEVKGEKGGSGIGLAGLLSAIGMK